MSQIRNPQSLIRNSKSTILPYAPCREATELLYLYKFLANREDYYANF